MNGWGGEHGSRGRRLTATAAITAALALAAVAPARAHWETVSPADNAAGGATWLESALATSSDGLATALFFQAAQGGPQPGEPYAIRRASGSPAWGAPAPVATPGGTVDTFGRPNLVAGGDGSTLGVFNLRQSTRRVTHATLFPAGATTPDAAVPVLCAGGTECNPEPPQVALDGAGNGYAVNTSGSDVVLARRDASTGAWTPPEIVASGSSPQLAVNGAGDAVIAYSRLDTSTPGVQVRRIYAKRKPAADAAFDPEVQVSGPNTTDGAGHAVVLDPSGSATIAFPEDTLPPGGGPTPTAPVIKVAAWAFSDATPEAGQPISAQPDGQARFAVAAIDPQGRVTVAWQSFVGHFEVFAAEQAGQGWSAPQHVSPEGSNRNASGPKVAVDPAGTATVVYTDNASPQGGDVDVKVSRRPTGGSWSAPESLRSTAAGAGPVQGGQRIAAGRAGQADVVFVQQLNGTSRLFATRFDHSGYARPKAASPVRVSLVPAFTQCTAPNRTHGPPLAFDSCAPPVQQSSSVTVGTPDANGAGASSAGSARLGVVPGDPGTPADEADVKLSVSVSDVRNQGDLSDYTGELEAVAMARITDRDGDEPSTIEDFSFAATAPCAATGASTVGATCSVDTTFNAIVPGSAAEGTHSIWQLGQVQVFDGGADGDVETAPNALFAVQGVFVP